MRVGPYTRLLQGVVDAVGHPLAGPPVEVESLAEVLASLGEPEGAALVRERLDRSRWETGLMLQEAQQMRGR